MLNKEIEAVADLTGSGSKRKSSSHTNRVFAALLLIACLMVGLIGCSSSSAPNKPDAAEGKADEAKPATGGEITIGMTEEPDTLDVQKSAMLAASIVTSQLGGGLVYYDPKTNEVKPYLAESYKISADGKTWTFILRSGVTFHDGTPLTATVYKQSFERALAPETAAPLAGQMLSSIASIDAPDDKTLVLHLKEPTAPLLTNLWDPSTMQPVSVEAVKKAGNDYGRNPIGVGPWKFRSWKPGESITLVRNDAFNWADGLAENQGPPRPDKLNFKFIKDIQTMLAALESGTLDIAMDIPAKDAKKYKDNAAYTVLEKMRSGVTFIEMNTENEILKDVNVRKALNLAVNKEAILKGVLQGEGEVADGPLPSSMFGYDPAIKQYAYKYNVEEAKQLLEASGWQLNAQGIREKDGKKLSLTLTSLPKFAQANQLFQGMLKEIGVELNIQLLEIATVLEVAGNGKFDLAMLYYVDNDPNILYTLMHSSQIGGGNHSRINSKEIDMLLEKGKATLEPVERQKLYEQVQKIAVDQAYWIPLYTDKEFTIVNKRVHGVKLHPLLGFIFQDSWVEAR